MGFLNEITEASMKRKVEIDEKKLDAALAEPTRPLAVKTCGNTIIAEVKYRSPSTGEVLSTEPVSDIVRAYERGGASALSVITEPSHFGGRLKAIRDARKNSKLPILRKDFLLNENHLKESRAAGTDGILLIVRIIGEKLPDMLDKADSLGLWALVETHSQEEIKLALDAGAEIIGVNNRDLDTLKVDLNTSVKLSSKIPNDRIFVVESGINGPKDIEYLKKNCARKPDAYLVGGILMKVKDKQKAVKELVDA